MAGDNNTAGSAGRGSTLVLYLVLFITMWIGWIVFLAGTAAGQKACEDATSGGGFTIDGMDFAGRRSLSADEDMLRHKVVSLGRPMLSEPMHSSRNLLAVSQAEACRTAASLPWWIVWFEFVCIILAMVAAFNAMFNDNFSAGVFLFFAIETTMLMINAGSLNSAVVGSASKTKSAVEAALAGSILLMIANLIYMFLGTSKMFQPSFSFPTNLFARGNKATATPVSPANTPKVADKPAAVPASGDSQPPADLPVVIAK